MGWIADFLKSFFTDEVDSTPELVRIQINDLQDWVRIRTEEIVYDHKIDKALINYINELKDKRWVLEVKIDEWEKKISSLGLSYKTEDISTIFRNTRKFLELLSFSDKPTIKSIFEQNTEFESHMEDLQKSIESSSFSYNYSFILSKEEKGLAINPLLKELLSLINQKEDFEKKVLRSGYTKMENLQRKSLMIEETKDKLFGLQEEMNNKISRLKTIEETKEEKESELLSLNKDPQFSKIIKTEERKKILQKKIEELDDLIFLFFTKIKPALRQFSDLNPGNKLIKDYLNNSTVTFYEDEGLVIFSLLKNLKQAIEEGKVSLLLQQKDDILALIVEKDQLQSLQLKYKKITEEIKSLHLAPIITKDISLKMDEAKYRLEHFSKQEEKIKTEMLEAEDEMKDLQALMNREIDLFQNLVKLALDKDIEIKL
ncbi:hypothetical protein HON71_06510 [Candidatus Woesearchaeota archaeon]|jgi:hypothetical protein|nr:hypothetical protein [Candidatus Woesearchaeota archaeon]